MQYRSFPKIDWRPSALGFGAMRLPVVDGDAAKVDLPEAVKMMRYAIDHGVNYIDTAYFYHGGYAEQAVGAALKDGYREKVQLASKFPARRVESKTDFDREFYEQLERLGAERIDFYLLHGLTRSGWARLRDMDIIPWMEDQVAAGRMGHLGFSFHDEYEVLKEIIDYYDGWQFCQLQYNYMDIDYQAGRKGAEYAANKGLGVVVMEPLRGGGLVDPPEVVKKVWDEDGQARDPVEMAFRWLWDQPEISLVLSGMSTMEQVAENVETAGRFGTSRLAADDKSLIERVREAYQGTCPIPCTGCRYCLPCPNGVDIPHNFEIYNDMYMYGDVERSKHRYRVSPMGPRAEKDAGNCTECGTCLELCPQHLQIPEFLKQVHEELSG